MNTIELANLLICSDKQILISCNKLCDSPENYIMNYTEALNVFTFNKMQQ